MSKPGNVLLFIIATNIQFTRILFLINVH